MESTNPPTDPWADPCAAKEAQILVLRAYLDAKDELIRALQERQKAERIAAEYARAL